MGFAGLLARFAGRLTCLLRWAGCELRLVRIEWMEGWLSIGLLGRLGGCLSALLGEWG